MPKYRACMSLSWKSIVGGHRRREAVSHSFEAKDNKAAVREARKWVREKVSLAKDQVPEDKYRGKLLFIKRIIRAQKVIPEKAVKIKIS